MEVKKEYRMKVQSDFGDVESQGTTEGSEVKTRESNLIEGTVEG